MLSTFLLLFIAGFTLGTAFASAPGGAADVKSKSPPALLVASIIKELEPAHPEQIKIFGEESLTLAGAGQMGRTWLLAFQKTDGEYCIFIQANENDHHEDTLASFIGCRIEQYNVADINNDGVLDALYNLKITSVRHDATVDEQRLFMLNSKGTGFCTATQGPRFVSDPSKLRCFLQK